MTLKVLVTFWGCVVFALTVPLAAHGAELPRLKVGLPPTMGSLPIAFAEYWGLFQAHGVDVQIVALNDDSARLQALMARETDGMVCDVTTAIRLYTSGTDVVITSTVYQPPRQGALAIVTTSCMMSAKRLTSLDALFCPTPPRSPCPLTFTTESDLEFVVDNLVAEKGYKVDGNSYAHSNNMPNLAATLAIGGVEAAVLPEPYITYLAHVPPSSTFGCSLIRLWDFSGAQLPPYVMVFRREVAQKSDGAITAFYEALREAVTKANGLTRDEMVNAGVDAVLLLNFFPGMTRGSIPPSVLEYIQAPHFILPGELDQSLYQSILDWMNKKRYVWKQPTYGELTTMRYLP